MSFLNVFPEASKTTSKLVIPFFSFSSLTNLSSILQKPDIAPTGKPSDFLVKGGSAWYALKIYVDPSTKQICFFVLSILIFKIYYDIIFNVVKGIIFYI